MAHFKVHDLRSTCRTLLAKQGTHGHVVTNMNGKIAVLTEPERPYMAMSFEITPIPKAVE